MELTLWRRSHLKPQDAGMAAQPARVVMEPFARWLPQYVENQFRRRCVAGE